MRHGFVKRAMPSTPRPEWSALGSRGSVAIVLSLGLLVGSCTATSTTTIPSGPVSEGDPVAGAAVYAATCRACHGGDLQGIDGLGKGLLPSEFVTGMSEDELAAFIAVGRAADDPENMQGIAMGPKGGNPSLSDQDLQDVAAYLKALQ
jgi:mono/diheme cytochrome c family protein